MEKKFNYSLWLKIRSGKSLWNLLEEGLTEREIIDFFHRYDIRVPKDYIKEYKKYYLENKMEEAENISNEDEKDKSEKKNTKKKTSEKKINLEEKLIDILESLIKFGYERIQEGKIDITSSDLIKAIELRRELGQVEEQVQERIDSILNTGEVKDA